MGASGGGVWKTANYGHSWDCVSDAAFASPSIGAIRVAPSNPDVVFVGTGSDGLRSNVIAGCGVYRSGDAGATWEFVGLPRAGQIGAVEVHPLNPDVVFVAAIGNAFAPNPERGLYRSVDGGATWERVLFVSETCGAVDVEFAPDDPLTMYASTWKAERKPWTILSGGDEGGVYRSTDGGTTWTRSMAGLPTELFGKIDLAVTAADPSRVYALVEAPGDLGGVYRSADRGRRWVQRSHNSSTRARPFYYTNIDASPTDADVVFVSATRFMKSIDGGVTWRSLRTPHSDHHDLWFDPTDHDRFIQGNDGGATITLDGGQTWSSIENQPTAELYQVAVDNRFPYWVYAGQQDNSTIRVPALPPYPAPGGARSYWQSVGGCETGPVIPDPRDANIVYANCKGKFGVFDFRSGQERRYDVGAADMYGHNPKDLKYRFQRVAPIHISPHDPDVVYHASQFLHRTRDQGRTWETISPDLTAFEADKQVVSGAPITRDITGEEFYSTIYAVAESRAEAGVIWVGANDGPIHVTRDNGANWTEVTPPDLAPGGRVQCVEPSPHTKGKAYACVLRYQFDDWRPHLYRTVDYGRTWTRLSTEESGFPQTFPTRVVREDPDRPGLLYCGTEWGLLVSLDDGARWSSLQQNLPITPVTDLVVHQGDLVVSTMGRSFWILDDLTPLRARAKSELAADAVHLFAPRKAVRMRYRPSSMPAYPSPGATLDWWIGADVEGDVTLEIAREGIFDAPLVRAFRTRGGRRQREVDVGEMETTTRVVHEPRLPEGKGHQRFRWDLRSGSGRQGSRSAPSLGGVRVAPGRYQVTLRVGEVEKKRVVEVVMDPRVAATGITVEDLVLQEKTQQDLVKVMDRAAALLTKVRDQLEEAEGDERTRLEGLLAKLVTERVSYSERNLISQIQYLSSVLSGGDRAPGDHARARVVELREQVQALEAQL